MLSWLDSGADGPGTGSLGGVFWVLVHPSPDMAEFKKTSSSTEKEKQTGLFL